MGHGRQANPDWGPVMWAVPSVALPIVIGILITALTPWWPVWAAAAVLALVLAASVPKRGPLRPQNYGRTPATVIAATGLTVAFVVVLWATAQQGHPLAVEVLPGLLLWAAATLLRTPLNKSAHISETGLGIATLGMAVAALLAGFAVLHVGSTSGGAALFLLGIAFLLSGGFTVLHRRDNLLGIVALPAGAAAILFGFALLRSGGELSGVTFLVAGGAALLVGVAILVDSDKMLGVLGLLLGCTFGVFGVLSLHSGNVLSGLGALLAAIAFPLFGVAFLVRSGGELAGVAVRLVETAILLAGTALLLGGFAGLHGSNEIGGAAVLALGVATLAVGTEALWGHSQPSVTRLMKWLTTNRS